MQLKNTVVWFDLHGYNTSVHGMYFTPQGFNRFGWTILVWNIIFAHDATMQKKPTKTISLSRCCGMLPWDTRSKWRCRWMFPKIGGKPPKWMVKIMESPIKLDDLGVPLFLETPRWIERSSCGGKTGRRLLMVTLGTGASRSLLVKPLRVSCFFGGIDSLSHTSDSAMVANLLHNMKDVSNCFQIVS